MATNTLTYTNRWGETFNLTPGVIDDVARDVFTQGQCLALADAVRKRTGWQLVLINEDECDYDPDDPACVEGWGDGDWCPCQALHVVARIPGGLLLDIEGVQTEEDLIQTWTELVQSDPDDECEVTAEPLSDSRYQWLLRYWDQTRPDLAVSFVDPVLALFEPQLPFAA